MWRSLLKSLIPIIGLSAVCHPSVAADRPCTPTEAMAGAEAGDRKLDLDLSNQVGVSLGKLSAVNDRAKLPQIAIKDQLSAADIKAFNEARQEVIVAKLLQSAVSRNTRNMNILATLSGFDEIEDTYEFDTSKITTDDPRAFYFQIISALREAQPNPAEFNLPDPRGGCTMEAALSLIEHFNMQEMGVQPTNRDSLELILDTRRLELLLFVMRKAQEFDQFDALHIKWIGDNPQLGDSFTQWLSAQPKSSQVLGNIVLKYIDQKMPSMSNYEVNSQAKPNTEANSEYAPH